MSLELKKIHMTHSFTSHINYITHDKFQFVENQFYYSKKNSCRQILKRDPHSFFKSCINMFFSFSWKQKSDFHKNDNKTKN